MNAKTLDQLTEIVQKNISAVSSVLVRTEEQLSLADKNINRTRKDIANLLSESVAALGKCCSVAYGFLRNPTLL